MKYRSRLLSKKLRQLTEHFAIVVVSGARQVGKTTLVTHEYQNWDVVTFEPVQDIGNARQDPELFLKNHPSPLILDEIQYSPELIPVLKRIVDQDKTPGQYILTGSQQWSVLKSISESLAGRAVFLDLESFSLSEILGHTVDTHWLETFLDAPQRFLDQPHVRLSGLSSIYEILWRGTLPEVQDLPQELCADWFAAYLRTYVERDIRLLLDAGDWQQFGQFVQLLSVLTAQEVNHSQLGRDIGVTPQTAKRWLSTLKATFQWFEIPAYSGNPIKRISQKAKGYYADTGMACHLNHLTSPKVLAGHPITGHLFETAVVSEVRKNLATLPYKPQLYHWRSHGGAEIDLIIEKDAILHPIEIKLSSRPTKKSAAHFKNFRETYPQQKIAPGIVLAPVEKVEQLTENDYVVPWDLD